MIYQRMNARPDVQPEQNSACPQIRLISVQIHRNGKRLYVNQADVWMETVMNVQTVKKNVPTIITASGYVKAGNGLCLIAQHLQALNSIVL